MSGYAEEESSNY